MVNPTCYLYQLIENYQTVVISGTSTKEKEKLHIYNTYNFQNISTHSFISVKLKVQFVCDDESLLKLK